MLLAGAKLAIIIFSTSFVSSCWAPVTATCKLFMEKNNDKYEPYNSLVDAELADMLSVNTASPLSDTATQSTVTIENHWCFQSWIYFKPYWRCNPLVIYVLGNGGHMTWHHVQHIYWYNCSDWYCHKNFLFLFICGINLFSIISVCCTFLGCFPDFAVCQFVDVYLENRCYQVRNAITREWAFIAVLYWTSMSSPILHNET